MQQIDEKQNKKWWRFRPMSSKDYGRTAIICLLLVGIRDKLPLSDPITMTLINILGGWGAIAGVLWIKEKIKSKSKKG
jgi:hypothetical protein